KLVFARARDVFPARPALWRHRSQWQLSTKGDPSSDSVRQRRRNWADIGPRLASALVLIVLTAVALYVGSYFFSGVVGVVYAGAYREWESMVTRAPLGPAGMALVALLALSGFVYPLAGAL